jgi:hypothetical protein
VKLPLVELYATWALATAAAARIRAEYIMLAVYLRWGDFQNGRGDIVEEVGDGASGAVDLLIDGA